MGGGGSSGGSASSAAALNKITSEINNLRVNDLNRYEGAERIALQTQTTVAVLNHPEVVPENLSDPYVQETKRRFIRTVLTLKDKVSQAFSQRNLTIEQKNQIMMAVDAAVVRLLEGRVIYGNPNATPGFLPDGSFAAPTKVVCSQFIAIRNYIAGVSSSATGRASDWGGAPQSGHNSHLYIDTYNYSAGFNPNNNGVAHMVTNTTLFNAQYQYNEISIRNNLRNMFENPTQYREQLKSLEGKVYFAKWKGDNSLSTYSHTASIGPINLTVSPPTITIYESNSPNGIRAVTKTLEDFSKTTLAAMKRLTISQTRY